MSAESDGNDAPRTLLALYDDALPVVYGYFVRRCGDRGTAEDLTSETFLAAMDAGRKDAPPPISVPWLLGVARHKLAELPETVDPTDDWDRRWTASSPRACWPGSPNSTAQCWRCATWTTARYRSAPS